MKKFYQYYKELPPWAKGVIIVGSALVAYLAAKSIIDRIKKDASPENKEAIDAANALVELSKQGIVPSFSASQYDGWAGAIVQAVNDCGTDEGAIYNVFSQMKNEADVQKLIAVYGVRDYKGCFENYFGMVSRGLSGTLSSELSTGEKDYLNGILQSKGITTRFA